MKQGSVITIPSHTHTSARAHTHTRNTNTLSKYTQKSHTLSLSLSIYIYLSLSLYNEYDIYIFTIVCITYICLYGVCCVCALYDLQSFTLKPC
jgi:hypothetical protein